ncbi:uncharacterized protein LOC110345200 [Heterocephalus glaber]|uniref:Uncharacterized protein LOC110345200 n=1 Tax=Heterocephalus glaber TaxID=10181 RepID=A0AAX6RLB9_HETGA|nr:uncharacterized protein LOC110345200 [Heterocephalus glaber]
MRLIIIPSLQDGCTAQKDLHGRLLGSNSGPFACAENHILESCGTHRISPLQTGRSADALPRSQVPQNTLNQPVPWQQSTGHPPTSPLLCTTTWFHTTKTQRTPDHQTTVLGGECTPKASYDQKLGFGKDWITGGIHPLMSPQLTVQLRVGAWLEEAGHWGCGPKGFEASSSFYNILESICDTLDAWNPQVDPDTLGIHSLEALLPGCCELSSLVKPCPSAMISLLWNLSTMY